MGLFSRRPSGGDASNSEQFTGIEVIRRIKVTVDRYWVTSATQADPTAAQAEEPKQQMGKTIDGIFEKDGKGPGSTSG